ncbi:hypothetical protein SAMN05660653_01414 [Desulfonatronum thiosulfatophilum]|uniref:Uncharacterized protein n=1 Tax=Desulfonatronum thiosulfatophilum TaxID=617002 RepID=A0A1G6C962_9BACT|nr:hypothetical protein SAMN05660653_01414 [Desulfonatronum thiosulfatophilum]
MRNSRRSGTGSCIPEGRPKGFRARGPRAEHCQKQSRKIYINELEQSKPHRTGVLDLSSPCTMQDLEKIGKDNFRT